MVAWTLRDRYDRQWRYWFAWRPVLTNGEIVWLEWVKYRYSPSLTRQWQYVRLS